MIRLIQVGLGQWSKSWLDAIAASAEVELVAIAEIDADRVARTSRKTKLKPELVFSDFNQALDQVEADGVLNLTPPAAHEPIILSALEAGLPVLTEKPLADTMAAAERIVTCSNQTGLLVTVAQNYRYKPAFQTIKRTLSSGELGRLDSVRVEFWKSVQLPGFHAQLSHPLLIDMSIHHFDLLRYLLESEPASIFARSWNPPWSTFPGDASASVELEFLSGVHASYGASWCATGEITDWEGNWRFDCEKGVLILRDGELSFDRRTEDERDLGGYVGYGSLGVEPVPLLEPVFEPQVHLLHEFAGAIRGGERPPTTCQDNIHSLRIVFEAIESAKTGQAVRRSGNWSVGRGKVLA